MKTSLFTQSLKNQPKSEKKTDFVDLHMHSLHSDGQYTVRELIATCSRKGMRAMAVTDHDCIEAYEEGREYAESLGIEYVPGVEISSHAEGSEIHILGYYYQPTHLILNQTLLRLQNKRGVRAQHIVQKLQEQGVEIQLSRVMEKAQGKSVGRPHIASVLVEEEYASTIQDAFDKYLHNDLVKEFEVNKLTPPEAIELIRKAGGVAVLAHPARTMRDDLLDSMVDAGLQGIETYCNGLDGENLKHYLELAQHYGLICSGGADFHGDKGNAKYGLGSIKVPYNCLEQIKKAQSSCDTGLI